MQKKLFPQLAVFAILIFLFSGCANRAVVDRNPTFNINNIKTIHIKNSDGGGDELAPVIADKLRSLGYINISIGNDIAPNADAVITYRDKWMWDITMYMIELTITVRDKESWTPIATGNSMHTSLTRKSEKEMVDEVLTNIFNSKI
ncbi:MAG: hypothetical protein Q7W05_00615 [Deltaproteobacteria bacterium]|jgi:hypothetical protein|nr:hypothetical protein [Deltaproteobacteria bacterium]